MSSITANKDILVMGGLVLDRYFMVDRWPQRGQDGFFDREYIFTGGCAINMAVTAKNLGGQPHIVSIVGGDDDGRIILDYLDAHDMSRRHIDVRPEMNTGKCLVFSEGDGERTFLTRRGGEEKFDQTLAEPIENGSYKAVGITGYYLLSEDAGRMLETLRNLKAKGSKILFDPSPLVTDIDSRILEGIMNLADIVTPNMTELKVLGGMDAIPELVAGGMTLICKGGASGGHVYGPEGDFAYESASCNVVDTSGAGDSFSGALLYGMAWDMDISQSIKLAVKCAAETCEVFGPHGFKEK